ncbi:MAG: TIGR00266 family protein [Acidimicrobiales bacterium]|nr:TIGR00266 family protein [Acidimicrobiales bacterium]
MNHQIIGTTLPVLEIQLDSGESIVAESGELSWLTPSVQMQTSANAGGGLGGMFKRAMGGGGIFLTTYTAHAPGVVAFATKLPGTIFPVQITQGAGYMIHRHGFLCGTPGIAISMGFQQSLGAGIFGGEGFVLQRLDGDATAFIELDGEVVIRDLQPGESLLVHPGHVGMFQEGMSFSITTIPGIKNKLFGGDGMFLAALTGPGRVWLQSLPIANLAHAIAPYLPQPNR